MSQIFVKDNSGNKVQVAELASIIGKQQMIFGGKDQDLILRTAGNVSVQVGNKLYPLTFSTATTTSTDETGSVTTILALNSDLKDLKYPGDGNYVFIQQNSSFFITSDNSYIQLSGPPSTLSGSSIISNSNGYLSYTIPQTLTGAQALQVSLNSGNINSFNDITSYTKSSVYTNQLLYNITNQSHYVLTVPSSPSLQSSWQPLYLSLINGGNILKPVSITLADTQVQTNSALHITGDAPTIFSIPKAPTTLFTIGASDYSSGLATWTNNGNVFFQLLNSNYQSTFNFITNTKLGNTNNLLTISNSSIAINTNLNYNYSLNVGGPIMLTGSFTQTGNTQSSNFLQGQTGFGITKDSSNLWTLEIDNIIVRDQLTHNPIYQTIGLDGSQIFSQDIIITNVDFIEGFPIYMNATASGQFSDNIGTVRVLSTRATNAHVVHIPIANLNTDAPTQTYEIIPLSYGFGDIYNDSTVDTSTTYNQASDLSYYTPTGTIDYDSMTQSFISGSTLLQINSISVYFIQTLSTLYVGDLLYYKMWDYNGNYLDAIRAEVVLVVSDGYFIYIYDGGIVNAGTRLIRIGNTSGTNAYLQSSSIENLNPFIELISNITTFNTFVDNYYYEQDTDNLGFNFIENSWTNPINTRVKIGDLSNILGSSKAIALGLTTQQYGLYSDNVYLEGSLIATGILRANNAPVLSTDVVRLSDLSAVFNGAYFGQTGSLTDGGHYNNPSLSDNTFRVGAWLDILSISGSCTIIVQVTFTNPASNVITQTFYPQGVSTGTTLSTVTSYSFPTMDLRALVSTTIQVSTTVSGSGTILYNLGSTIEIKR